MNTNAVPFLGRMFLDNINFVQVWVEPTSPLHQHDVNLNISEVAVRLRVSTESGKSFNVDDLPSMSLTRDTIHDLEKLCKRRLVGMAGRYLPQGTKNVMFLPEVCRISEYSRVEVTFSIKGTLLKHKRYVEHH